YTDVGNGKEAAGLLGLAITDQPSSALPRPTLRNMLKNVQRSWATRKFKLKLLWEFILLVSE
ncbi:hypothetical protein ACQP3J_30325, partial [Escherichia coli]